MALRMVKGSRSCDGLQRLWRWFHSFGSSAKSVWDWSEEKKENREDPMEAADGQEAFADGPEIISVEDTMAATMDSDSEA